MCTGIWRTFGDSRLREWGWNDRQALLKSKVVGFSMKLDAPERDMHDDPVLSAARQPGGVSQSPETQPCGLQ